LRPQVVIVHAMTEEIIANIPADDAVEKVEIAGPGFINFYVKKIKFRKYN